MITCYLDSQDYSTLTDPRQDTHEHREIKHSLLHLAKSKQVRFVFSAAAVCESIALTSDAANLAELRAELLSELCESNALISFDRLIAAEIDALSRKDSRPIEMIDQHGRWFPEIPADDQPLQLWERMCELAKGDMKAMGLSRQERRAKYRALTKNRKLPAELNAHLNQQDTRVFAAELMRKYPMRPEDAELMVSYALGRASAKDFSRALTNGLTDPRWMMKWFTTEHGMASPIADVVRKPGRELGQVMRSLAEFSAEWATKIRDTGLDCDPTGKRGEITSHWQEMEKRQLVSIAQGMARKNGVELGTCEAKEVSTFCPGISAGVRSLYSSVWDNVGGGRKEEISDSQPVDSLHAFYAPYVQVFRADRFMALHIQRQVKSAGTIVVARLTQLVGTLENELL